MPEIHKIYAPGEDVADGDIGSPCPAGNGQMYIRFLDVGLGNCTYVICPNGKRLLIDAGSTNLGTRTFANVQGDLDYDPASKQLYVDVLVISHAHQDHQNALRDLVGNAPLQAMYYGSNAANGLSNEYNTYAFRDWRWRYANSNYTQRLEVNVSHPNPLLLCEGGVAGGVACNVTAIAASVIPPEGSSQTFENKKNTSSVVIKIDFGNDSILITGDATADTENFILNTPACNAMLPSHVLLVPHHGSDTSSTQNFINQVSPETVIISCKDQNRHQLPKLDIVNRYIAAPRVRGLMTDQNIGTYNPNVRPAYAPIETQQDIWQTGMTDSLLSYNFNGT